MAGSKDGGDESPHYTNYKDLRLRRPRSDFQVPNVEAWIAAILDLDRRAVQLILPDGEHAQHKTLGALRKDWSQLEQGTSPMADLIYCGTDPPVGADGTQQLLLGSYNAIWCPPIRLPFEPSEGDKLWLVWRSSPDAAPLLLGGGRVIATDEGQVLWTNRTLHGVRAAAAALGYPGPTNMAFLHLTGVVDPQGRPPIGIGQISSGLNVATPLQTQVLSQILPIP
jgi:hypothetical protein